MNNQLPDSNRIGGIKSLFYKELQEHYPDAEIGIFFRLMMEHFFGIRLVDYIHNRDRRLSESEIVTVFKIIRKLKRQVPWQYIVGETEFWGLTIRVNESVLIPRPETEELVSMIAEHYQSKAKPKRIIDLCSGSGCIALSLKKIFPDAEVIGIEISSEAIEIARKNAAQNKLDVAFIHADLMDASYFNDFLPFDLIVSNPPYIADAEKSGMESNVLDHEPSIALFVPDKDPLIFYRTIAGMTDKYLKESGEIWLEINSALAKETKSVFAALNTELLLDLSGKNRFLVATQKPLTPTFTALPQA